MKKHLAILLAAALLLCAAPPAGFHSVDRPETGFGGLFPVANAVTVDSGFCGGTVSWAMDDEGLLTISGTGPMEDYESPEEQPWYSYRSDVKEIVIENDVSTVGKEAFDGFPHLKKVTVPDSVTSIGDCAFNGCGSLSDANIPDSVTDIGAYAFNGCDSLWSADIPDSVTSIGQYAFCSCANLHTVVIPEGVTVIREGTFSGCSLLPEIYLPAGVTEIGASAFKDCDDLNDVYFTGGQSRWDAIQIDEGNDGLASATLHLVPTEGAGGGLQWELKNGVLTISGEGPMADYPDANLPWYQARFYITRIVVKYGVTSVGSKAFWGCSHVKEVMLPATVTRIGEDAFRSCGSLESVFIPKGVTAIENGTFYYCEALTEVTIPVTVTHIRDSAFGKCESLSEVWFPGTQGQWDQIQIGNDNAALANAAVNVGINVSQPREPLGWALEDGVLTVTGTAVMRDYTDQNDDPEWYERRGEVTKIVLENGVPAIGAWAFYNFPNLTEVVIPDSVEYIGEGAFYNSNKVTELILPAKMKYIDKSAFWGMDGLTRVVIPTSVTEIGDGAFNACVHLTDVCYPGTKEQWDQIAIDISGGRNDDLLNAAFHFNWAPPVALTAAMVTLGWESRPFNGSGQKPAVTVKKGSVTLTEDTDYTVTYADGCTQMGVYTVTVAGMGGYTGEVSLSFTITEHDPHTWDGGTAIKEATCTETGKMLYTCTLEGCGRTKTETTGKKAGNHTGGTEVQNAKPSTCKEEGYTGDVCCKGCGAVLIPGEVIAKTTDHAWNSGEVTKEATAAEEGEKTFTCALCGQTRTEAIPKLPPEQSEYRPGDVDNDGEVSSGDARLALRASVQLEHYEPGSASFLAADVDKNGEIEASDARTILRVSVQLETF